MSARRGQGLAADWGPADLHRDQRGITLTETLVGLAITAMLIGLLGTSYYQFFLFTRASNDKMLALASLETADLWLSPDSQEAAGFTLGSGNLYGTFEWPGGDPQFRYSYDPLDRTLVRERLDGGSVTSSNVAARYIAAQGDVEFSLTGRLVHVSITATRGEETASGEWDLAMRVR